MDWLPVLMYTKIFKGYHYKTAKTFSHEVFSSYLLMHTADQTAEGRLLHLSPPYKTSENISSFECRVSVETNRPLPISLMNTILKQLILKQLLSRAHFWK